MHVRVCLFVATDNYGTANRGKNSKSISLERVSQLPRRESFAGRLSEEGKRGEDIKLMILPGWNGKERGRKRMVVVGELDLGSHQQQWLRD